MGTIIIQESINSVVIEEKTTTVNISSIGIQGPSGYPTPLVENAILSNDGDSVLWRGLDASEITFVDNVSVYDKIAALDENIGDTPYQINGGYF